MLVSHSIPNLFNGVSQQSPTIRQASQGEVQLNMFPSIVEGLHKRHPTKHVAKLSSSLYTGAFTHSINRDTSEKYEVVITNGGLAVWDKLTGAAKTVTFPDGYGYLANATPETGFDAVTIADYTLITNRSIIPAMSTTVATANPTNTAYFHIRQWPIDIDVHAVVDGISMVTRGQYSGGDVDLNCVNFVGAMNAAFGSAFPPSQTHVATSLGGGLIRVVKASGSIASQSCYDGYGDTLIRCLNNGVERYSDLPRAFVDGFTVAINGNLAGTNTTYYVKYSNNAWVETVKPGCKYIIDATTMPYRLVRNANGTFTFSKVVWANRPVGDPAFNFDPSFIGSPIQSVFFFRNRFGMLSGENVILSRAGAYFNYFQETMVQVLDTDPVDISVTHNKVSNLKHAIPFNKNLLLFSDLTQFILTATDVLTPKTVTVSPTTEFEASRSVKPVAAGANVYFVVEKSGWSGVREYFVTPYQATYDADDITAHVPKYIPGGVVKMAASSNEDILFVLSSTERNAIYTYKYYWKGNEKIQSAWSKWTFPSDSSVMSMEMIGTKLYLVISNPDGLFLEYIDLQSGLIETDLPTLVNLDRKVSLTGVYSSGTGLTTWTLPYVSSVARVVLGGSFTGSAGMEVLVAHPTTTTLTATGDFSAGTVYAGVSYESRYRFSQQYAKDQAGVALGSATLKLRKMSVFFTSSGYFRGVITPEGRASNSYYYTGIKLGTLDAVLGSNQVGGGVFNFPVITDASTVTIDLINDTYLPSFFQSAEWEGFLHTRNRRT